MDDLVQDCGISSPEEIPQSYTKPFIWSTFLWTNLHISWIHPCTLYLEASTEHLTSFHHITCWFLVWQVPVLSIDSQHLSLLYKGWRGFNNIMLLNRPCSWLTSYQYQWTIIAGWLLHRGFECLAHNESCSTVAFIFGRFHGFFLPLHFASFSLDVAKVIICSF